MKAEELRKGIYFYPINRRNEIHLPIIMPCKILTIGFDTVTCVGAELNPAQEESLLEFKIFDLSPIPLTEEWLLKFGFEQNIGVASREYLFNDCKLINHYENGFLFTMNYWEAGKYIKYVHQLQNLYFALTGEVLTINEAVNT